MRLVILFSLTVTAALNGSAQVSITAPSQTVYACGNSFPTSYASPGDIVITEQSKGDFSAGTSLILTAPANFEFRAGFGSTTDNGQNVTVTSTTVTATTITIAYTINNTNKIDQLTISGIMIRGVTAVSSGNITRTSANPGTGTIAGITNGTTNFGTLTSLSQTIPSVTSASAATICSSTAQNYSITGSPGTPTYLWSRAAVTGISNGAVSNQSANPITESLVNTVSAPVNAGYLITPTVNGCSATPFTYTLTVNPVATVTPVSNVTTCNGASTSAINFSSPTTGGTITYSWTNNNTAIGLAASGSGNIAPFIAANNTAGPITATITITPTYLNTATCAGTPSTFTITVNPTATVNAVSSQTVCKSSSTTAVTFSSPTTGGSIVYNWTNSNTAIGLAASGTGNIAAFTGTNTTTGPISGTITVTPAYTNAGSTCNGTATTFTITVNPLSSVDAVANQVVCNNTSTTGVTFSSPTTGGSIVYNWINSNTAIGLGASGSGNIASFTGTNTTTGPISGTITVTPAYTNGATTCNGTATTFTITVNPAAVVTGASNQTVCNGANTSAIIFGTTATGGSVVYNWTNNTTSIGLAATGSGNIAAFTGTNNTTAPVTATIVVTPAYTSGGTTCNGTPSTFTITVNPTATVNAVSNQTVCKSSSTTAVTFSSPTTGGSIVYNWINSNTAIGLGASGTGNIAAFTGTNTTTGPISGTITVTPAYTNGGTTCNGTATTFTITVNPAAVVTGASNQTVCNGANTSAIIFGTTATGGSVVYNWTNNTTSIGLAATGSGNIASFTGTNNTTAPVTATIVVTPAYTNGGTTCNGTASIFTITVNPTATVNAVSNQTVCKSSSTTAVTFSSPTIGGSIVYNWTNSNTAIGLAASGTGNIAAFTGTNTTTGPISGTITVTPAYTNGGSTCNGTATTFTITVNPLSSVDVVANQVVCKNTSTTGVTFSSPTTGGSIVYNWTNSNTAIGLAASGSGNIASFTGTNTTTGPISGTITVTPAYTNGATTCNGTATTFTITVNPAAAVTGASNQTVCNNASTAAVNFGTTAGGGSVVYNWTNNTVSIGLAASGSGNIAAFTGTNNTTAPVTATIIVTPAYTNGSVTCNGTPSTFTITVNPTATVNTIVDQVVCKGASTSAVTFGSATTGGTITYNWTNSNTATGLGAGGAGNIPSFTATNASSSPITSTITVTPSYVNTATCAGTPVSFTITVNPVATVTAVSNVTTCNGLTTSAINFSSPTTGGTITYNWTNNNTAIGLAASGSGGIGAFSATNLTTSPITATITVTPSYLNGPTCAGTPTSFTITVNPSPSTADAGPDQTGTSTCGIVAVTLAGNNPTVGTGGWSMVSNPDGLGSIANPALRNSSFSGTAGVTYVLRWTISNSTCVVSTDDMTVALVPNIPVVSAGSNLSLCGDATQATPVNATSIVVGGAATAANYVSVLWTSGGTGTWTNQTSLTTATYTPSAADKTAGSVVLTLTATGNAGCGTASSTLTLVLGKTIQNNNIYLLSACAAGSGTQFVIDQSGAAVSGGNGTYLYTWGYSTPGNSGPFNPVTGYTNCSCPSIAVTSSTNGFYIRTITSGGCTSLSGNIHVNNANVSAASTYSITGGGAYCQGGSGVAVGLSSSIAQSTEFYVLYELYYNGAQMSPRDTVRGTGAAISFGNQTAVGTYTVYSTIVVIGGQSCSSVQTSGSPSSVTVSISAQATTSVAGPNQTICASSTSLAGNNPVTGSGIWTLVSGSGTITTPTLRTSTVTGLAQGSNVFRWTITNGACSNYSDVTIIVSQQSAVPVSASASPVSICAGSSSVLTLSGGGGGTGEQIKWYTSSCGGTLAGTGNSLSVTPAISTTYYGRYEDGAPCNFVTTCVSVTVTVSQPSGQPVSASASPATICGSGSALLTLNGGGGGTGEVIKWYTSSCGGTLVGTGNSLSVSPAFTTTYYGRYEDGAPCNFVTSCADVKVTIIPSGTWFGIDNNWNNSANWCSGIPNTNTKVFIPVLTAGFVYPATSSDTAYCNDINIAAGASVTVNAFTLKISGSIVNSGTFDASAGTIEMNGSAAQSIPALAFQNNALLNLIINNPAGVTLGGALDIYRSFNFRGAGRSFNSAGFLTFKSTASETAWLGDITGNTFSGSATVERYIPAGRKWRFLSVPAATTQSVKNSWMEGYVLPTTGITGYGMIITDEKSTALANGFDAQSVSGPSMKVYSGITNSYTGISNTANLLSDYSAYMVFVRGDRTALPSNSTLTSTVLRVKGPLKTGLVQVPGIPSGVITGVGNPYASAIDINSVLNASTGLSPNMYLWDPKLTSGYGLGAFQTLTNLGGFFIISPGGGSYGSAGSIMNTIESGQAFFVRPGAGTGTVKFNEAVKTTGSSNTFFTAPYIQRLSALLLLRDANNNATLLDGATVYYNDAANSGIDYGDARKLTNTAENVSVRSGGILLSAEQRMLPAAADTVFINTANFRAGQYRWNISAGHLDDPARTGFLVDQYTNTVTALNLNGETFYDFTVVNIPGSYALNRFMIVYQQATVVPVRFTGISAVRNSDRSASVTWDVQNEINIASYLIERSDDGRVFTPAGTTTATNSSHYTFRDSHAKAGNNYYRIKASENSGRNFMSNVVKINPLTEAALISVYPNPAKNKEVSVYFENQAPGLYWLQLLNDAGQEVFTTSMTISSPAALKTLYPGNIAKGAYHLKITGSRGEVHTLSLTIL